MASEQDYEKYKKSSKLNIALVDDHEAILQGVASQIRKSFPGATISTYNEGLSFLSALKKHLFDIYIVDLSLQDVQNMDLILTIRKIHPDAKIIIHTMHEEIWIIRELKEIRVNGIVLKSSPLHTLKEAIESVYAGETFHCQRFKSISKDYNNPIPDSHLLTEKISNTELKIIRLIAQGYTYVQIAEITKHTNHTINSYKKNIFRKFEVNNAPSLVAKAVAYGIIKKEDINNTSFND